MKEVLIAIGIAVVAVAMAMLLLSVRVLLKRGGRFSSQHISQSKVMRERGIHCAMTQHREAVQASEKRMKVDKL